MFGIRERDTGIPGIRERDTGIPGNQKRDTGIPGIRERDADVLPHIHLTMLAGIISDYPFALNVSPWHFEARIGPSVLKSQERTRLQGTRSFSNGEVGCREKGAGSSGSVVVAMRISGKGRLCETTRKCLAGVDRSRLFLLETLTRELQRSAILGDGTHNVVRSASRSLRNRRKQAENTRYNAGKRCRGFHWLSAGSVSRPPGGGACSLVGFLPLSVLECRSPARGA
jgi:hypothetical protein